MNAIETFAAAVTAANEATLAYGSHTAEGLDALGFGVGLVSFEIEVNGERYALAFSNVVTENGFCHINVRRAAYATGILKLIVEQ